VAGEVEDLPVVHGSLEVTAAAPEVATVTRGRQM